MTRSSLLVLSCGLALALVPVGADAAVPPIVGKWNDNGGVLTVTKTGPNTFEGHRTKRPPGGFCPNTDPDVKVTGSGRHYSGTVASYFINNCGFAGRGGFQVDLSADLMSASWASTPPPGSSCCPGSGTWTRIGNPPCKVPATRGKKLGKARKALENADCVVGKVRHVDSDAVAEGHVVKTSPGAGKTTIKNVKVFVSRG